MKVSNPEELIPFIRAERSRSKVISFRADEYYVTHKGQEVTRQVVEEVEEAMRNVPSNEAPGEEPDDAEPRNSRRIFVVHGHDISALTARV